MRRLVIFTDLDGTLLEYVTSSHRPAEVALRRLRELKVPLIFCSAKTRAELEGYRQRLRVPDPFIPENGGAVFIPAGCFEIPFTFQRSAGEFRVIEIGWPITEIRRGLEAVRRETGIPFRGYGELTAEEISKRTGLSLEEAAKAMEREYDETVILERPEADDERFTRAVKARGLRCVHGGLFHHVMGPNDKGKAVQILSDLYRKTAGKPVRTAGLGDSRNDAPMLAAVDEPYQVQKPDGTWEPLEVPGLKRVEGIGPAGWNRTVLALLSELDRTA